MRSLVSTGQLLQTAQTSQAAVGGADNWRQVCAALLSVYTVRYWPDRYVQLKVSTYWPGARGAPECTTKVPCPTWDQYLGCSSCGAFCPCRRSNPHTQDLQKEPPALDCSGSKRASRPIILARLEAASSPSQCVRHKHLVQELAFSNRPPISNILNQLGKLHAQYRKLRLCCCPR